MVVQTDAGGVSGLVLLLSCRGFLDRYGYGYGGQHDGGSELRIWDGKDSGVINVGKRDSKTGHIL